MKQEIFTGKIFEEIGTSGARDHATSKLNSRNPGTVVVFRFSNVEKCSIPTRYLYPAGVSRKFEVLKRQHLRRKLRSVI